MASTPNQVNGSSPNNNGLLGKRKKSRGSKRSYLSKWLDKTLRHVQESTPGVETYESFGHPNWAMNGQFGPGYESCGYNTYGFAPEPMSLPTLPTYYNSNVMPPFYHEYRCMPSVDKNIQVQRSRHRHRVENKTDDVNTSLNAMNTTNCMLPKDYSDSQDYTSLPPIITSVGDTTSTSDVHTNEKEEGVNARRYSDPCVQGLPDVARPANADAETESEASSDCSDSQVGSRLLLCLLDQINSLKMTNEKLNRELQETKAELHNVRAENVLWQKGSGASLGTTTSHTLNNNGIISGQYSPGFVTDLVREIRDAARLREEALYSRLRSMFNERTDNGLVTTDAKLSERTLEEIKNSLRTAESDKRCMMDRIAKLEEDLRNMKIANGGEPNENVTKEGNDGDSETERVRLRKEVADLRKAKQNAEEHALKLERLVTQLRSKFNGMQPSPSGPDSLSGASEHEHEAGMRTRRTSVNSNSTAATPTVVFGPVTDL